MESYLKRCSVCHEEKLLEDFYKQSSGKYGVASRCKVCLLASNKRWRDNNKEKSSKLTREWQIRNKEKCLAATREWRKRNLSYDAARVATYRARKNKQMPKWADENKIKEIYLACPDGYHVDHIIPLKGIKASGLHVETNLQYLPARENLQKRNLYGW